MKLAALALLAACSSPPASAPAAPRPAPFTPTAFSAQVSGAGRPVIFIPGLASPGNVWDGAVAHLGGRVQAHVLTLAGFAGVPPLQPPSLHAVHDQLVQYIDANHLDHPIIVGHSLGGMMSLWLGETDPAIGGVVDVDGFPYIGGVMAPGATPEQVKQQAEAMKQQMAGAPHDAFVQNMQQFLGAMVSDAKARDMLDAAAAKSDQATVADAFAELLPMDLRPDLGKITVPVIVVAAGESRVPREQLEKAWHDQIDAVPHHELVIVDHAKHFVMLDQPEAFYAALDRALK